MMSIAVQKGMPMKRVAGTAMRRTLCLLGCAVLVACGGGSGSVSSDGGDQRAAGALVQARSGELVDYVKTMLGKRVQQRQFSPAFPMVDIVISSGVGASANPSTPGSPAVPTFSDTTVQESGVDEDDLLKTDGVLLLALERAPSIAPGEAAAKVQLHRRRADGKLDALATVTLPGESGAYSFGEGLYYAPDLKRVAVLSSTQTTIAMDLCDGGTCTAASLVPVPIYQKPWVWIDRIDVSNPVAPALGERLRLDGRLIGSRRIGRQLIVVTQHSPQLPVEYWPASVPQSERDAQITQLLATDVLPTLTIGRGTPRLLAAETDCFLQPANASLGIDITTITVLDLGTDATTSQSLTSRCFAGGTEALYMSSTNLYLATTRYPYDAASPLPRFAPEAKTDIHKFALGAGTIEYRGSGEVAGHLGWDLQKRSYRMSEHGGHLRVLSYTAPLGWGPVPLATAPSPALLSVLRESSTVKRLDLVARLPNDQHPQPIGKPGEQVYAVRFLGARGYVVTFRRIDPLYVLDLASPIDPKIVGELLTAGFSDYLFPIDNGLLFGVGKDADANGQPTGVKVALFDVADPTKPRELASRSFGSTGSHSGLDTSRHGINLHPRNGVVRVGLPLVDTDRNFYNIKRGLQRFEINPGARSLAVLSMVPPAAEVIPFYGLGNDRSVQIEDHVYYFADQQINAVAW